MSWSRISETSVTSSVLTNEMKLRKGQGGVAGAGTHATGVATSTVMTVAQISQGCSKENKVEEVIQCV